MLTIPLMRQNIQPKPFSFQHSSVINFGSAEPESDIFIKSASAVTGKSAPISQVDYEYKNKICKASGIPNLTPERLQSVIGPDELKDLITKNQANEDFYTPGYRPVEKLAIPDSYGLENVKSRKFGGSFHIHTVHSDGILSVQELLDQAVEYADKYAQKNNSPFTIGITDHNTINGCKEAVEIIAQNPEKYKNLRVILGAEISTKEVEHAYYKFKKPEKYHVLSQCINPFDEKVISFFESLNEGRTNPMYPKQISIEEAVEGFKTQKENWFSLAHPAYPNLKRRVFNIEDIYTVIKDNIRHFKECVGEKCLAVEKYYLGYYDDLATDTGLHKSIEDICDELKILKSGGIDTHGNSIFYNSVKELRNIKI